MGETPLEDALMTAKSLQNLVAQLVTGLQLASNLTEQRVEPGIMHVHAGDYLNEFIHSPARGLIDRLERLQDRYFLIKEP